MRINTNFSKLGDNYLFAEISKRVKVFSETNPGADIIRMGIGDVTLPLAPAVVSAMEKATKEMGDAGTFRGYGEYCGYDFLREAICGYYSKKNIELGLDEVFVSEGAKSDVAGLLDIFEPGITALVPDPVYPVYVDTNILCGNTVVCIPGNSGNFFLPMPDYDIRTDLIYLCSPNNPTGAAYSHEQLKIWIEYAIAHDAVILYDAAYEGFIRSSKPTSIFQIEGARDCAIEMGTFSKTSGFTGTRCAYTIVPKDLKRNGFYLANLWSRRQATKFNGVSYIVQRGAAAAYSPEGLRQSGENINYYLENAKIISNVLSEIDIWHTGGDDAPYIWLKCPNGMSSWDFFDNLLEKANVVGTPGVGFGNQGEGFLRLTAFASRENTINAMRRLKDNFAYND